uniref:RepB-like DNA primase domain-containing protein n=1 Tax=viral metagenome TaxID=1070528 RepID=A0A6H1ZGU1_9ZZZZ
MLPITNPHTAYWVLGAKMSQEFEDAPMEEFIEQSKERGNGLYYTVNELGFKKNAKGNLRYRENVISLLACFADFDSGTKQDQIKRIDSFLTPSCIVESGRGYHAYWEFKSPVNMTEELPWVYLQKAIADKLGGDPACSDPARLLRLPGSWHIKDRYRPSLVRVVRRVDTRYTLDELLAEFPHKVIKNKDYQSKYRPLKYIPTPVPLKEGERHAALKKMAGKVFHGTASTEIENRTGLLKAWYITSCNELKKDWEKEVDDMVGWVLEREMK